MNTAARIETSSEADKIHVSQDCAELLMEAGKRSWLHLREDVVIAKGKGALVTYFLKNRKSRRSEQDGDSSNHSDTEVSTHHDESDTFEELTVAMTPSCQVATNARTHAAFMKTQRLIDWNCELLIQVLKKVIARRNVAKRLSIAPTERSRLTKLELEIGTVGLVATEIAEIIPMPKFDAQAAKEEADAHTVEISETVFSEMRDFISMISSMYRENPFHCFEHASHVTMSVSKLLSRIVASDGVADIHQSSNHDDLHGALHDHTFGITSDPLTQFAVVLSALIHDVDHRG